ncbi:DNA repair metallo-beta-lactamase-domain-containing protein [Jimgerdemannia flammicorona]|uniref:DNA repair metallo-beta-lactamase-domain-containing protein n=1 Tax=Jimgerdemannia flammicorona TaxID=994334 RepID=A0A433D5V3_9FUNG|nr:DNA repair metallo-beta-lactamase-domain-containing protein [Jimgerdemannia flammicorona]
MPTTTTNNSDDDFMPSPSLTAKKKRSLTAPTQPSSSKRQKPTGPRANRAATLPVSSASSKPASTTLLPKTKRILKSTSANSGGNGNGNLPYSLLRYFASSHPQNGDDKVASSSKQGAGAVTRNAFRDADIAEAIRQSLGNVDNFPNDFSDEISTPDCSVVPAVGQKADSGPLQYQEMPTNCTDNKTIDSGFSGVSHLLPIHPDPPPSCSHHSQFNIVHPDPSKVPTQEPNSLSTPSEISPELSLISTTTNQAPAATHDPDGSAGGNPGKGVSTINMLAEIARGDAEDWGDEDDEIAAITDNPGADGSERMDGRREGANELDDDFVGMAFDDEVDKTVGNDWKVDSNNANDIEMRCPICSASLAGLSVQQSQVHVNNCLDNPGSDQSNAALSASPISPICARPKLYTVQSIFSAPSPSPSLSPPSTSASSATTAQKTSWSTLFGHYKAKVAGIWSAKSALVLEGNSGAGDAAGADCHFHSDHYGGLTSTWTHGPIYCSTITANLVIQQLRVKPEYVHRLTLNEEHPISDGLPSASRKNRSDTLTVTLIDANHCPGSALFLFKIPTVDPNGRSHTLRYLHTGDFRACPQQCLHPAVAQRQNGGEETQVIDILYLDTTYLNPRYAFPAQEEVVAACCEVVKGVVLKEEGIVLSGNGSCAEGALRKVKNGLDWWIKNGGGGVNFNNGGTGEHETEAGTDHEGARSTSPAKVKVKEKNGRVLVVVGTYLIGKEKVFVNIAKTLGSKVYVTSTKKRILHCLENPELEAMLTESPREAQVHIVPMGSIKVETLSTYLHNLKPHFTHVVAFRPTGWTYRAPAAQTLDLSIASLAHITAPVPAFTSDGLRPSHSSPTVSIYGVPYSEHSSFRELAAFVASLDVRRIVPTVNVGSEKSRRGMETWFKRWEEEKRRNGCVRVVAYKVVEHCQSNELARDNVHAVARKHGSSAVTAKCLANALTVLGL